MFRGVFFCLLLALVASGETLDEAVHTLARKVAARLTPADSPRVVLHNLSTLGGSDAGRARAILQRALRSASSRAGQPVDVTFTVSQNVRGYLLIAELERGGDRVQEMQPWQADAPAQHGMRSAVTARVLWEQDSPMLDVAVNGDRLFILEPAAVVTYLRGAAGWERPDSHVLEGAPVVRDPRGRLQVTADSVAAYLPGVTCRGAWNPALDLHCEPASETFSLGGAQARFTPGRNTLEVHPRMTAAELVEAWGDDFVPIESGCARGEMLATAPGDRFSADSLTAWEMVESQPVAASEPAGVPGPVLALWPAGDGAVAIVRNTPSGTYAAYHISVDCRH